MEERREFVRHDAASTSSPKSSAYSATHLFEVTIIDPSV
jgi:hypothetical protein